MAITPDGKELYVACEASHSVVVVDVAARKKVAEIAVGRHPIDVAFSPDGTRAYVSNRLDDTVSVVDVAQRKVVADVRRRRRAARPADRSDGQASSTCSTPRPTTSR